MPHSYFLHISQHKKIICFAQQKALFWMPPLSDAKLQGMVQGGCNHKSANNTIFTEFAAGVKHCRQNILSL